MLLAKSIIAIDNYDKRSVYMPTSLVFLLILFIFIFAVFIISKRPIYEVMGLGLILILCLTGNWSELPSYIHNTFSTSLLYVIFAFIAVSEILSETNVINDCINVILALIGRVPGGAGYVAVISSAFMGALSGSGPGNVASTGVITIPTMKKSGFPAHLAANIEASASTLGNMIPPSGVIVASFGCLSAYMGEETVSIGKFWLILWSISLWFILQRLITVALFCKYYKVKPVDKAQIPSLRVTLKNGWKSLFLPIVILLPFVLDFLFKDTFFTEHLGATGAKQLSNSLLLFVPGAAAIYAVLISDKSKRSPEALINMFEKSLTKVIPVVATLVFSYCIGEVLEDIGAGDSLVDYIGSFNLSKTAIAFVVPLFTAVMGMIFPGSAQIAIFGTPLIALLASSGFDPVLAAAMLPCICGAMSGIIPPVAVCMLTAMGIAQSEMKETTINIFIWVLLQYLLSVITLLGFLPIFGI